MLFKIDRQTELPSASHWFTGNSKKS